MEYYEFKNKYKINASQQQEEAILSESKSILVLSSPGSGKTSTLIARIGHLIFCKNIPIQQILTITYTTAAAKEMSERFTSKFELEKPNIPKFSTINGFSLYILRCAEYSQLFTIPKLEPDNTRIIKKIYLQLKDEYPTEAETKELASQISNIKNGRLNQEEIDFISGNNISISRVYEEYEKYKKTYNLMDFDDQMVFAYDILKNNSQFLDAIRKRYPYINVDEAQDTSLLQHQLIELIVGDNNIFMVADDDQSIFGFRSAYPQALYLFDRTYNDASTYFLETNYRSTKSIVKASNAFIKQNKTRFSKEITTPNKIGDLPKKKHVVDIQDQYKYIMDEAIKWDKAGKSLAVIYRNNESVLPLINLFDKSQIPVECKDDGSSFFTIPMVFDIIAIMNLIQDPCNFQAFKSVYTKLGLYIKKTIVEDVEKMTGKTSTSILQLIYSVSPNKNSEIISADIHLKSIRPRPTIKIIQEIANNSCYSNHLFKDIEEGTASKETVKRRVDVLRLLAEEYPVLEDFLKRIEYLRDGRKKAIYNFYKTNITFTTMHSSKGREFDKVIIMDAIQGVIPSEESIQLKEKTKVRDKYEEDVRLFYVAATRAREQLEFLVTQKRFASRLTPSEFIDMFLTE